MLKKIVATCSYFTLVFTVLVKIWPLILIPFFSYSQIAIFEETSSTSGTSKEDIASPDEEKCVTSESDLLNESRDRLNMLSEKFEQFHVVSENKIEELQRKCSEFEIIETGNEVLEKRLQVLELEIDELNKEKIEIQERFVFEYKVSFFFLDRRTV